MKNFSALLFLLLFFCHISSASDSTQVPALSGTSGVVSITMFEESTLVNCKKAYATTSFPMPAGLNMTCPPGYMLQGQADPYTVYNIYMMIYPPVYDPNTHTYSIETYCNTSSTEAVYLNVRFVCTLQSAM